MTDGNFDTLVAQTLDIGAVGNVRTGDAISNVGQHLGNAAHANATDADKMHRTDIARQLHLPGFPLLSSPAQAGDPEITAFV